MSYRNKGALLNARLARNKRVSQILSHIYLALLSSPLLSSPLSLSLSLSLFRSTLKVFHLTPVFYLFAIGALQYSRRETKEITSTITKRL